MEASRFSFELPPELIAQRPPERRGHSRLMVLPAEGDPEHRRFSELPELLSDGDVMVVNDTRVRHSRLLGFSTGGDEHASALRHRDGEPDAKAVEFLLLTPVAGDLRQWQAMAHGGRRLVGRRYQFPGQREAQVESVASGLLLLRFDAPLNEAYFDVNGSVPLPPYIERPAGEVDASRYQTVYAERAGSAAAPTAGLHFDEALLEQLRRRGVEIVPVTLEVGGGTFTPIRVARIEDHLMHVECYEVPAATADAVNAARLAGRSVVAVGTTVVRTLESAYEAEGGVIAGSGSTGLFIHPGFRFRAVDRLVTNFHTPRSSLLVMVCAFAGVQRVLQAYREAVARRYRFFSYGDATFLSAAQGAQ